MNEQKTMGFILGIVFVFLILSLVILGTLTGFFFNNQVKQCENVGYDSMAGINTCQKSYTVDTPQGDVEVKQIIKLKTMEE